MNELFKLIWDLVKGTPHFFQKAIWLLLLIALFIGFLDYMSPLRSIQVERVDRVVRLNEANKILPLGVRESLRVEELIENTLHERTIIELAMSRLQRCWNYSISAFHSERVIGVISTVLYLLLFIIDSFRKKRKIWDYVLMLLLMVIIFEFFILIEFILFIDVFSHLYQLGKSDAEMFMFRTIGLCVPLLIAHIFIKMYGKFGKVTTSKKSDGV